MLNKLIQYTFSKVKLGPTQLLINGKFVNSLSGKTFETINPATEEVITKVQQAGPEDLELAVKAARKAFDSGPWRKTTGYDRGRLIHKLADLMEKNSEQLAALESLDNGKPLSHATHGDIPLAIKTMRYFAGWADKIHGTVIPINSPHFCYMRYEPVGVCGQIIPWNFPILMQTWKWAPLLATGCVTILKPAEQTPLTALLVGQLALEAGFPEGVINVLPGFGDVGQAIVRHPLIDKVAFTGSTEVGHEIMANAGISNLKRVTLELGGKSPNIICHDADIDLAVKQSQLGLYLNQGQCCIAGSRIFVHESIYDEFVARSVAASKSYVVGDPFDAKTNQGPQVSKEQMEKILRLIETGKQQGAKLLTGGSRHGTKGYYVQPTVFADVQDDMTISKEEIFGPVMNIYKFKTYDEVIERANNTIYGLGAGIVTQSIETYQRLANAIRAGTVYVNCYDVFDVNTPFGGFKSSGLGRELGEPALRNYLEMKTVIVKQGENTLP